MQSQHILLTNVLTILAFPMDQLSPEMHAKIDLLSTDLTTSTAILAYIQQVAEITGTTAASSLEDFSDEINIILHKLKFIAPQDRPTVLIYSLADKNTLSAGSFLADSIQIAGGIPVTEDAEKIAKIIFIDPANKAFQLVPELIQDNLFAGSEAVEKNQIYIIQDPEFAQIPGVNYLKELEILAEIIQPKYFIFGHEGQQWLKFELV